MNILTDCLPEWILAGKHRIRVRTDFRIWIEFDRIMHQRELDAEVRFKTITALCLCDGIDVLEYAEPDAVMDALCNFYLCFPEVSAKASGKSETPVFSFEEDGDYIYAAFLSGYGIDLVSVPYLHWFIFSALIKGLDDNCRLVKIMSLRGARPEQEANPKRRNYLRRLKELYALSDNRTEEEKDKDIAAALSELL